MSRPQNIPDYPDEIMSLPMFHWDICSREQAENYVLQYNKGNGSYIVRPNSDNDPSFVSITISISGNETCNARVLIEKSSNGFKFFISEKLKFSTFNELLAYYREHRIHCKQGIDNLRLIQPLRKMNQSRGSLGNIMENLTISSVISVSEDAEKVVKQDSKSGKHTFLKKRANSESQIPANKLPVTVKKLGGSLKNPAKSHSSPHENSKPKNSVLTRTHSQDADSSEHFNNIRHYTNSGSIKQDPQSLIKCKPPAPLPRTRLPTEDNESFYYTSIQLKKDYFEEIYQCLKAAEQCECGLRLVDSDLALGWTIHRSHDLATLNHIFFQHGETTTWEMPVELVSELTFEQIKFIVFLCQEGRQAMPIRLRERLDKEMRRGVDKWKTHF